MKRRMLELYSIVVLLLTSLGLIGCDSAMGPEPALDEAAVVEEAAAGKNGSPVVGSITGAHLLPQADHDPRLRFNTTLNIQVHADGSTSGQVASHNRNAPPFCFPPRGCTAHARPVCATFSEDGKDAWAVIEVTQSDWPVGTYEVGELVGFSRRF